MRTRPRQRGRRDEARRIAEACDAARFIHPEDMPFRQIFEAVSGVHGCVAKALDELSPGERLSAKATEVSVELVSADADGANYRVGLVIEHACPTGVCDDCIE